MKRSLGKVAAIGFALVWLLTACTAAEGGQPAAQAAIRDGVLDAGGLTFDSDTTIRLDGQWQFVWNRLVAPNDSMTAPWTLHPVPAGWRGKRAGQQLSPDGAATYRLVVKVRPSDAVYGLRISNIRMASEVYVNGEKLGGSGRPGTDERRHRYANEPYNVFFRLPGAEADIVIHVSNFEAADGGIPYSLYFGSAAAIANLDRSQTGLNMIVVVALLMLGVYHLCVFATRTEEKGVLHFGLHCLSIALAFACNGERIFLHFFALPFNLFYKLQTASLILSIVTLALYMRAMFAGLVPAWLTRGALAFAGCCLGLLAVAPYRLHSHFDLYVGHVLAGFYLAYIVLLAGAYARGRYGSFDKAGLRLFLWALCGFLACLIDYGLYWASLLSDYAVGYIGAVVFCLLISLMMSRRFSEAYRTIEGMTLKLRETDRLKDEFLVHTSHEFQTPLHGIINISQAMLESAADSLDEPQRRDLTMIRDSSRRLSALVRDILDLEKLKRGELALRIAPVDAGVAASVVLDLFRHLVSGKPVELRSEVPDGLPHVLADENRLNQVLSNLVSNGVKFTEAGSVTVGARVAGRRAVFAVEDTGAGIPEAEWEAVFEPFRQAGGVTGHAFGGTGVGLAICRKLLQLMDGDIRIERSAPGQGTRFVFTLPLADLPPAAKPAAPSRAGGAERAAPAAPALPQLPPAASLADGRLVLLAVDDEPSNLHVLTSLFAGGRYNLICAANGREALRLLDERRDIALVLLDVMMPGLSGYDVCRRIRRRHTLFELPVVLMTARYSERDVAAGFEAGANDFIVKPFDAQEIRARTETLLQLKLSVREAMRSEMAFLQSQIKPHFLFNSLNVIVSFCREDPARAEQLISRLGDYLRRSFEPQPGVFVPLEEELQLVYAYAELEQARFEERLAIEYDIDERALGMAVLPLTIQPLVENAIRHGIMRREDGGIVRLTVRAEADGMRLAVWDNGVGIADPHLRTLLSDGAGQERQGVGLLNIHRRLEHYFGEGLRVSSREGEWTQVECYIRTGTGGGPNEDQGGPH